MDVRRKARERLLDLFPREFDHEHAEYVVETILDHVEVEEVFGEMRNGQWMGADEHYGIPATHRRLILLLPTEEK